MRRFHSEKTFQKYRPHSSSWRRFWDNWKKRKREKAYVRQQMKSRRIVPPAAVKSRKEARKNTWLAVKICILAVSLIVWICLLAYLPYFKISNIICSGLNNISKSEIENFVRINYFKHKFLPEANYFLINESEIAKGLIARFSLDGAVVKKIFPGTLEIDVKEKEPQLVYDNGKKYFLLDANGEAVKFLYDAAPGEFKTETIVPAASNTSSTSTAPITVVDHTPNYYKVRMFYRDYPLLYDKRGLEVSEKEQDILAPEIISNLRALQKGMVENGVGDVKYFVLSDINTGVIAVTDNPYKIYLSLSDDPAGQISNLKNILLTTHPASYIDLRFGGRIYWK